MAARASSKKSSKNKTKPAAGTAKKATAKAKPAKKSASAAKKSAAKSTKKKATAKKTSTKAAAKPRPVPAGTGELVHTRLLGVAKRLLGPTTTAGGDSASAGISHTNPARSAMLKRLLG